MGCLKFLFLGVALALCARADDSIEYFDVGGDEGSSGEISSSETSDEIEYSPGALLARQPVMGEMTKAQCACQKTRCTCCSLMPVNGENHELCLGGWVNASRLAVGVDIFFDAENIYTFEISAQTVGKICVPLPLPPPFANVFKVCVGNYFLDIDLRIPSAMVCLYGVLTVGLPLFTVDMNCIKLDQRGFSWNNDVEFEKKGLFHLNINCMDPKFEVNVPDEVKLLLKHEADRFVDGWNERDSFEDKAVFLAETYWRYCPINYIIQGVEKIAPHVPGAIEYAIDEASLAIQSYAKETALEMSKMTSDTDKVLYMAKRMAVFTPAGLINKAYSQVAPFVEGIVEFAGAQIASSLESFFMDIMKEAATYNTTTERVAFFIRKQAEYSPAGLIAKAVTPIVIGVGEMAFDAIKNMAVERQNELIEKLKKAKDDPVKQALVVLETLHSYTPQGMIANFIGQHMDTISDALSSVANTAKDNFIKNVAGDPEKLKTTGGQIAHGVELAAKLSNPIGMLSLFTNWFR